MTRPNFLDEMEAKLKHRMQAVAVDRDEAERGSPAWNYFNGFMVACDVTRCEIEALREKVER